MSVSTAELESELTLADLHKRFGPMPLWRIRREPAPGTATERDVLEILAREDRLCELVDGVLVEKTMGFEESFLALAIGTFLNNFVAPRKLGIVTGADGTIRLAPGLVRIPDVAFFSWDRIPNRRFPRKPIPKLAPDLAVEVLSASNTRKEMQRKLADYFKAGVRLVWYVDPKTRMVQVFTSRSSRKTLRESQTLDGGAVLPGFSVSLRQLFAEPTPE